jgi:hypothetical protein
MTVIAAVVGPDGKIWMGGDSAGVDDNYSLGLCRETKVWENGGILFGASGSFRVAQVVRWHMEIPSFTHTTALEYVTGPLVDAIRSSLEASGALNKWEEDSTESMGGNLLIGYDGHVFEMWEDFGVGELLHDYGAVGCGGELACGSLATTEKMGLKPKKRVELALATAERDSAGVRGPMTIIHS